MNTLVPAIVAERYATSRVVVFSTGCVYALVPAGGTGANEVSGLEPPCEYANSCLGRERVFTHFANQYGTQVLFFRLCYANRYQTQDVVRAVIDSGRDDIAIYTGNDDSIVTDFVTPFQFAGKERRIVGGLLGQGSQTPRIARRQLVPRRARNTESRPVIRD